MSSVLGALSPALPPELLELLQQGPRGAEEKSVLLGDGVIQRRVIAVTAQPATESGHVTCVLTESLPWEDRVAGRAEHPRPHPPVLQPPHRHSTKR